MAGQGRVGKGPVNTNCKTGSGTTARVTPRRWGAKWQLRKPAWALGFASPCNRAAWRQPKNCEKAAAEKRLDDVPKCLSDKWLADCTLFGPAARVREGLAAWYAAGITTPIIVPSSAGGNQMKAFQELFAVLA